MKLPVNGLLEERAYGRAEQRGGAGEALGRGGEGISPWEAGKGESVVDNRTPARFFAFFA